MKHILAAAALALLCAVFAGCGVAFGDAPDSNDFFVSLRVTGDKTAGAPLTAAVAYETFYPDPVEIVCELRQGGETLRAIGRATAPGVTGLRPDDDGVPGNFSFDFVLVGTDDPEEIARIQAETRIDVIVSIGVPGTYKIECLTAKEVANFIIEEFSVRD